MKREYIFVLAPLLFCGLKPPGPGDVIINEFYWHTTGGGKGHYEAVELLVANPGLDLNGLRITDADEWNAFKEHQCVLEDKGKGFLRNLPPGTLIVIYDGIGKDDVDPSDFLLEFYARSSGYCFVPTGRAFAMDDRGDDLHLTFRLKRQVDFIKYRSSDYKNFGGGDPGGLPWKGYIDVGRFRTNAGTRFMGASAPANDDPGLWESYDVIYPIENNLGKPNGGANTGWIMGLRGIEREEKDEESGVERDVPKAGWNVRDHVKLKDFVIQSHRGAGTLAPENTIPAFELAWKLGTIPEADIRTTRDGVIVAFHDKDFSRLVKDAPASLKKKGIKDLAWHEVQKLDVGSWLSEKFKGTRVPRMEDVFEIMEKDRHKRLYLDIKNVSLEALAGLVRSHEIQQQVILASTHYGIIKKWKELVPESGTLHWMGGSEDSLEKRLEALRKKKFRGITQLQIHVWLKKDPRGDPFIPSSRFIVRTGEELHKLGIVYQVLPWGVARKDIYWKLMDLGVESFATDHPMVTLKAVREYYARKRGKTIKAGK